MNKTVLIKLKLFSTYILSFYGTDIIKLSTINVSKRNFKTLTKSRNLHCLFPIWFKTN